MDGSNTTMVNTTMVSPAEAQMELFVMLVGAMPGITITKYLSVAGLVVLLYDHLLLLGEEVSFIWGARSNWLRTLFLFNRYTVPIYLIISSYELSGLSAADLTTEFCRVWIGMIQILIPITLAITNIFVVLRVLALWDYNKRVTMLLLYSFSLVYLSVLGIGILGIIQNTSHISFQPLLKTCALDNRPKINLVTYSLPLGFDGLLFIIMLLNALHRPRTLQTAVVKQLFRDGFLYFLMTLFFRLFNIITIAAAPLPYIQLGLFINWAMITALVHRMLISIGKTVDKSELIIRHSKRPEPMENVLELTKLVSIENFVSTTNDMFV